MVLEINEKKMHLIEKHSFEFSFVTKYVISSRESHLNSKCCDQRVILYNRAHTLTYAVRMLKFENSQSQHIVYLIHFLPEYD